MLDVMMNAIMLSICWKKTKWQKLLSRPAIMTNNEEDCEGTYLVQENRDISADTYRTIMILVLYGIEDNDAAPMLIVLLFGASLTMMMMTTGRHSRPAIMIVETRNCGRFQKYFGKKYGLWKDHLAETPQVSGACVILA